MNTAKYIVTITATDPATGQTMTADLVRIGELPLDVLFAGLLRTAHQCHGLRTRKRSGSFRQAAPARRLGNPSQSWTVVIFPRAHPVLGAGIADARPTESAGAR